MVFVRRDHIYLLLAALLEKSVHIKSPAVQDIYVTVVEPTEVITGWCGKPVYSLAGQIVSGEDRSFGKTMTRVHWKFVDRQVFG